MTPTHASFFSGVGGMDLGLERAGWRTVSFSEIDPYACAVLAERWPGVPNLGSIVDVVAREEWRSDGGTVAASVQPTDSGRGIEPRDGAGWTDATLWTGGFPCQDLSVAGKRAGFTSGTRSSLAFTFLDLVERYRPRAILLENVPGLLSSHAGRDMARLLGEMVELGYGVAYRVLDARHFGVPQRRRRVFIVGLRSEADDPSGRVAAIRAAAVLAVGTRCGGHPPAGVKTGAGAAAGVGDGALRTGFDIAGGLTRRYGKGVNSTVDDGGIVLEVGALNNLGHHGWTANAQSVAQGHVIPVISPSPDADRVRATDGLAGRVDGGGRLAPTLTAPDTRHRVHDGRRQDGSRLDRIPTIVQSLDTTTTDPLGLDSHRYRCCGNGVVAPVAEWIGRRLAGAIA